MATAAAALAARARRQIQHHFFAAEAVRPDRALPFAPANGFERRQFDRMRARNIIREEKPGDYWLDVVAYDIALRARFRRVRATLLAVIAVLVSVMLLGGTIGAAGH